MTFHDKTSLIKELKKAKAYNKIFALKVGLSKVYQRL